MKLGLSALILAQLVSTLALATELKLTIKTPIPGCRQNVTIGRHTISSKYVLMNLDSKRVSLYTMQGADLASLPNSCSFIIPEDVCQNPEITNDRGQLKAGLTLKSQGVVLSDSQMTWARFTIEGSDKISSFDLEMDCSASAEAINQKLGRMLSLEVK
jgi:hypothetical protein